MIIPELAFYNLDNLFDRIYRMTKIFCLSGRKTKSESACGEKE